jgi:hypothetical protein
MKASSTLDDRLKTIKVAIASQDRLQPMDNSVDYPIKVLGIAPLIMVTLPTVSSLSSGGFVPGPRRPPPLVVASFK